MQKGKELITIKNLSKSYSSMRVLGNLDFSLNTGEIVSIMGYSGAGKTTFLNVLLGLDNEYSGEYSNYSNAMSCVFQEDRLLDWLTVQDNIKLVNKSIAEHELFEILEILNLKKYSEFYPKELSGGMKQRVSIARALVSNSKIMIMDEPLKSTDKELSNKILKYLKQKVKKQGISLVMVTHDLENAYEISDRILVLGDEPKRFIKNIDVKSTSYQELTKLVFEKIYTKEKNMKRIPGHNLLARLGKTRLRPGGKNTTDWLIEKANLNGEMKILEVACNMGTTLTQLARTHNAEVVGVDMNEMALEKAKQNVKQQGLEDKVTIKFADARELPFPDETFDVIINEAMLTMLNNEDKQKAINEYYRVLKKGGVLLTHDIDFPEDDEDFIMELRRVISVPATPLKQEEWLNMFKKSGFTISDVDRGNMIFLSERGMLVDEGYERMMKIYENAVKDECYEQFLEMKKFFLDNEHRLFYLGIVSKK